MRLSDPLFAKLFAQHRSKQLPPSFPRRWTAVLWRAALLGLVGCGQQGQWSPPEISNTGDTNSQRSQRFVCGEGVSFSATVNDESAVLDGDWGKATLLRDAGGQGEARVYSNRNLRAVFGLGPDMRTAELHELTGLDSSRTPMHLSCRRE